MKKKIILFDVDGTIFNSYPGIKHCINHTLGKLNISIDEELYRYFVGPPLIESFMKYANMDFDMANKALKIFREEYKTSGKNMYQIYSGVIETLDKLKSMNFIIGTATSKPENMAKLMFEESNISQFFDEIVGSRHKFKEDKIDVLKDAIKIFGNPNIKDYVLVGDTYFDYEAAERIGMDCIIVKYGFGSKELFNSVKYCVDNIEDILNIIEKENS